MRSISSRHGLFAIALVLVLTEVCAGCQQTTQSTAAAVTVPFALKEIRIGRDVADAPQGHPEPLTTDDPAVVRIAFVGRPPSAELSARLVFLGTGQMVGSVTQHLSQTTASPVVLRFDPTPNRAQGRYLLEIKLDGKLAQKRDVDLIAKRLSSPVQTESRTQ